MACRRMRPWHSTPDNTDSDESSYSTADHEEEEEEEDEEEDEEDGEIAHGSSGPPNPLQRPVPQASTVPGQNHEGNASVFIGSRRFRGNPRQTANIRARSDSDSEVFRPLENLPVGDQDFINMNQLSTTGAPSTTAQGRGLPASVAMIEGQRKSTSIKTKHPDPGGGMVMSEDIRDYIKDQRTRYNNENAFTSSAANQLSRSSAAFHYRMGGRRSETLRARLERPRTPSPGGEDKANRPYALSSRRRREDCGAPSVNSPGKRRRLASNSGAPECGSALRRLPKWQASVKEPTVGSRSSNRISVRASTDELSKLGLYDLQEVDLYSALAGYQPTRPKKEPTLVFSIVFLSQCLPRNFSQAKRVETLQILTGNPKFSSPFVPACVTYNIHQTSQKKGLMRIARSVKSFFAPGTRIVEWTVPLDRGLLHLISSGKNIISTGRRKVMPKHPFNVAPSLGPSGHGWPAGLLPLEIFSRVATYLPRDAILNMRLVNHEFERNMASAAFETVVVAFRPEIYGMMVLDSYPAMNSKGKGKGKARATGADGIDISHGPYNEYCGEANPKAICNGMKVFQSLGAQMKKFAMTFEVDERALTHPPEKGRFEILNAFYGQYIWPIPHYSRYELCAGLERVADDTRCMTEALSNLSKLIVLGLSVESGLGWISGPDQSDRASIFKTKPEVFGSKYLCPDAQMREMRATWRKLRNHNRSIRGMDKNLLQPLLQVIERQAGDVTDVMSLVRNATGVRLLSGAVRGRPTHVLDMDSSDDNHSGGFSSSEDSSSDRELAIPLMFRGIDIAVVHSRANASVGAQNMNVNLNANAPVNNLMQLQSISNRNQGMFANEPLIPRNPNPAQREWLLETEWAQRAFVSSYCLAIMDNASTFQNVRTLTIARLSSRFLDVIQRQDMWEALSNIESLTLMVSPDWRDVVKQHGGFVGLPALWPSEACKKVFNFLETCIAGAENIKNLKVGWIGGGEHATGIYARNKHILPAPVIGMEGSVHVIPSARSIPAKILSLPFVENLTLVNCWFLPHTLKAFVSEMSQTELQVLKLESVSLTAEIPSKHLQGTTDATEDVVSPTATAATGKYAWLTATIRKGSWGDVIDNITPGDNLLHKRFEHGYGEAESVKSAPPEGLRRIEFESCGYTRLLGMKNFDQSALPPVADIDTTSPLLKRAHELAPVVMATDDPLLGQIVPSMEKAESDVLETAFGMRMGWTGEKKYENREDGQPVGGSGRFSGVV